MRCTISFEENKVAQMVIVDSRTEEAVKAFWESRKPEACIYGVRSTQAYDMKPGIPVLFAPDDTVNSLEELIFRKTLNARKSIVKYGDKSSLGTHAVQVWRVMEGLLNEAGLWERYELWEAEQGGIGEVCV